MRNLALASKHVFASTTRIAAKVESGEPVGYDAQGSANVAGGTMPGGTKEEPLTTDATTTTEEPGLVDKALEFLGWKKEGGHPGQGIEHRSDRANEVAQTPSKTPTSPDRNPVRAA